MSEAPTRIDVRDALLDAGWSPGRVAEALHTFHGTSYSEAALEASEKRVKELTTSSRHAYTMWRLQRSKLLTANLRLTEALNRIATGKFEEPPIDLTGSRIIARQALSEEGEKT